MSRSNAKTARVLREEESLHLRKHILKAAAHDPRSQQAVFDQLAHSSSDYQERINKLQSFKKKSKVNTVVQSHKVEWIRQQLHLSNIALQAESDLESILESIIIHSPNEPSLLELVDLHTTNRSNRADNHQTILSQWGELKAMWQDSLKSIKKMPVPPPPPLSVHNHDQQQSGLTLQEQQEGDERNFHHPSLIIGGHKLTVPRVWLPAITVFADILVQVRSSHHQNWQSLISEESRLVDAILLDRRMVTAMLQDDRLDEQNRQFRETFQMDETDGIEVEMFMQEWFQKLHSLDLVHERTLSSLNEERATTCERLDVDPGDRNGGWVEGEHDLFSKIYRRGQQEGMPRKQLTGLLTHNLPHRSPESLHAHEEWYRAMKALSNRKRDVIAEYTKTREGIVLEAKEQLQVFRESTKEAHDRELKMKEHETNRLLIHVKLEELRAAKSVLMAEIAAEAQRENEIEMTKLMVAAEQARQEHEIKRKKAEEYKRMKLQLAAERQQREEEELQRQRELLKETIERNRPNVEQRYQQLREKEDDRKQKEAEVAEQESARLELLMKLAQQVPYYESIQNAQSKLDHITASVRGHEYFKGDDLTRGFIPMFGFTDQKVIRDSRFRLATALRSAGVIQSDAAKAAISHFHPRPHLAIHGLL